MRVAVLFALVASVLTQQCGRSDKTCSAERFVAFSANLQPQYLFYVPLTAAVWRRIGWTPIVTISVPNPAAHDPRLELIKEVTTKWSDAKVIVLPEHQPAFLFAQLSRVFTSCLDLPLQSEIMMNDADMWVFNNDLWDPVRNASNPAHYFGFTIPNPPPDFLRRYKTDMQMCHWEATVEAWRDILGVGPGTCDIENSVVSVLAEGQKNNQIEWGYDQNFVNRKLRDWHNRTGLNMDVHHHDFSVHPTMDGRFRPWTHERYPTDDDMRKYHSAHVPRPGFVADKWSVTRRLLGTLFDADRLEEIDKYVLDFKKLHGER